MLAPIAGAALGSVVPGVGTAIGGAIGSGLSTGIKTGNPLAGILSAGGSYLGGQIGGEALSSGIGSGTLGGTLGSTAANFIGPSLASTSLGSIAGSSLGSSLGESAGTAIGGSMGGGGSNNGQAPFSPSRAGALGLPQSLSQFGGLDPTQQATNIATKGVYGGGQGPDETKYFMNLVNRQLVDDAGNVGDQGQLAPVENSFLSQLGLGGGNTNDLLKGIQNYKFS